ncbi:MAG: acyl-CoA dehydrogenase family protein [Deltaproteobacteria bacterium]|nr:acyl-CoA dehydrogenase family protein [Deltaproteobacteria bacterium]
MTCQITSQQRQIIASVRALAQREFRNDAIKYMDGTFPWENMRKLDVLGMSVPEEYGGLKLSVFDGALILEEISSSQRILDAPPSRGMTPGFNATRRWPAATHP